MKVGEGFAPRRLDTPMDRMIRKRGGRRSQTRTDKKRGRYIQARPASGKVRDLAFDATIRQAAPYQKQREAMRKNVAFAVRPDDYMEKVRMRRAANLILFLVDASWSMAVTERMEATKGAIFSLLTDAYQRRDRVGLIIFQKDRAVEILKPTNSVMLAHEALQDIPIGGKTPLSAGLQMAYNVLRQEILMHPDVMPLLVVMTDGAGNVSMGHKPPLEEGYFIADKIAEENIHSIVINMESVQFDQGLASTLAKHLDAPCYSMEEIRADYLYHTVRNEMELSQTQIRS
ncbi:MAG: VWA domain-containing protein [Anaerolineaceae bacterium]|nr:VWA domain-containing protein [Anaerolineaceae bacterium]